MIEMISPPLPSSSDFASLEVEAVSCSGSRASRFSGVPSLGTVCRSATNFGFISVLSASLLSYF